MTIHIVSENMYDDKAKMSHTSRHDIVFAKHLLILYALYSITSHNSLT